MSGEIQITKQTGTGSSADQGAQGGAAVSGPWFSGLIGDNGALNHSVFDKAPDSVKPFVDNFKKYQTIDDWLVGAGNVYSLAGRKGLMPLPENATDAMRAERKAQLDIANGVPTDPKGYGINKPAELPDVAWKQESADQFAAIAHKYSIPPSAVKDILGIQTEMAKASIAEGQRMEAEYFKDQSTKIQESVRGLNMPLDRAQQLAELGAKSLGVNPKGDWFRSVEGFMACVNHQARFGEDHIKTANSGNDSVGDERQEAIRIMSDSTHPLHAAYASQNPLNPLYQIAVEKVNSLYAAHARKNPQPGPGAGIL